MSEPADKRPRGRGGAGGWPVRRAAPLAVLVVGLVAFFAMGLDDYLTLESLKEHRGILRRWVEAQGLVAGLSYAAVYAVAIALSIPGGLILTVVGGFLFGPYWATVYIVFGATIGATVVFFAARYAFADFLRAKAGPALAKMEAGFKVGRPRRRARRRRKVEIVHIVSTVLRPRIGSLPLSVARTRDESQ